MDRIDQKILNLLQQDCTLSVSEIAEQVNLSTTPCWKRIKQLETQGIIQARVALLDAEQLNLGLSVFVHIKTQRHDAAWLRHFSDTVMAFEQVVECYRMSGEWDYLLRLVVKDIHAFDRFYKRLIEEVGSLSNVTSSFAMEQVKYTTALPLATR